MNGLSTRASRRDDFCAASACCDDLPNENTGVNLSILRRKVAKLAITKSSIATTARNFWPGEGMVSGVRRSALTPGRSFKLGDDGRTVCQPSPNPPKLT